MVSMPVIIYADHPPRSLMNVLRHLRLHQDLVPSAWSSASSISRDLAIPPWSNRNSYWFAVRSRVAVLLAACSAAYTE